MDRHHASLFFLLILNYACSYFVVAESSDNDLLERRLTTGKILGTKLVTARNITAFLYLGIPYAEAPVGDLRFRAPRQKKPWSGTIKTVQHGPACPQLLLLPSKPQASLDKIMTEDCLFINVMTSERCLRSKDCPVMFYVFGGGWNIGFPALYDNEFLTENFVSKDIVIAMPAYRVNLFGFFNIGKQTTVADQNIGLLDLEEALRWTQRDIDKFGGDRNRVTLMGHSSGAESVDFLSLSPRTVGLFNQIVVMSAVIGDPVITNVTNVEASKTLSIDANCATEASWAAGDKFDEILECLRKVDMVDLLLINRRFSARTNQVFMFFGPAIDGRGGMLPETVAVLNRNRRPYPCLTGTTNYEFRNSRFIVNNGIVNETWLRMECEYYASKRYSYPVEIGQACVEAYTREPDTIADLSDDDSVYIPTYERGEYIRQNGVKVYKYSFEYEEIGAATIETVIKADKSPSHDQDLVYVMGLKKGNFTAKDEIIRDIYSSAFSNFIKTGDPSMIKASKWEPTDDRNNYFKINFDDNLAMPGNTIGYHDHAVKFWLHTAMEMDKELALKQKAAVRSGVARKAATVLSLENAQNSLNYSTPNGFIVIIIALSGFIFLTSFLVMFVKRRKQSENISDERKSLNPSSLKSYS